VEFLVGLKRGRNTCRLNDAVNSIGLGTLAQQATGIAGIVAGLWAVGAICTPRAASLDTEGVAPVG